MHPIKLVRDLHTEAAVRPPTEESKMKKSRAQQKLYGEFFETYYQTVRE